MRHEGYRAVTSRITDTYVEDVQADEIWGYVGCKEKTRERRPLITPALLRTKPVGNVPFSEIIKEPVPPDARRVWL
jgi:hypothetical protein